MRLRRTRRDGLSLIEVLAAMAIFLMALTALVHLVNTSSNYAFEAHHRTQAARLAHSKMNEVLIGAVGLQSESDAPLEDDPSYHWSLDVQAGPSQGLYNVTVRVTHKGSNAAFPIELSL